MKIYIQVKPNSRKGPLIEETDTGLIVYVREPSVDNRANCALIELLAGYYGVSKSYIKIIHGFSSRRKIIDIIQ